MKKLLLALLFLSSVHIASAQHAILVVHDTVTCSGLVSSSEITAIDHFVNKTGSTQQFTWIRQEVSLPAGWTTSVCDADNCFSPTDSSEKLSSGNAVPNNDTTLIDVNFLITTPGTGVIRIKYFGANTDTTYAWFVGTATTVNGIAKVQAVKDIVLYPSPASDNLYVAYNSSLSPSKVEIYNVLGQMMQTILVQPGNGGKIGIPVSGLSKGLYFLRVYSSNSSNIITKQFTKA